MRAENQNFFENPNRAEFPPTHTHILVPPQCSPLMAIYSAMAIITDDAQGQH